MGGEDSEVTDGTTEVLLEAANFEPLGILRSSERLALRTAGSNRWEKGVDPYLAENAAVLASRMLVDLAGARLTGHVDVHDGLPQRPVVRFRPERASKLIGVDVPPDEQRALLEAIGFEVSADWDVTVPTWRAREVTREVDVIEEVARPLLDRLPLTMPLRREVRGRLTKEQRLRRLVEDVLVGAGLSEAYTWSLVASDPDPAAIRLPDPMTSDQAILRTTLLPGLVEAARGRARRRRRAEGRPLRDRAGLPRLGRAAARGAVAARRCRPGRVRGGEGRRRGAVRRAPCSSSRCGGRRTRCSIPGRRRRPKRASSASCTRRCSRGSGARSSSTSRLLFERVPDTVEYEDVLTYPAARQDIAVAVDEDVEAGALVAAAREAAGPLLREARVFDVYRGEQVGEGRKSVAIHLAFQSPERTLTDEEAAELQGEDRRASRRRLRRGASRLMQSDPRAPRVQTASDPRRRASRLPGRHCPPRSGRRRGRPGPEPEADRQGRARVHHLAPHGRRRGRDAARSGTYDIEVTDESNQHSFALTGPGVNQQTGVEETGTVMWTVTFANGTYVFRCTVHTTSMRGTVTSGTPAPAPGPKPITAKTKLVVTSGPTRAITLKTAGGAAVKLMKVGTYSVTVRDRGAIHNVHLKGPGYDRKTTPVSYRGTQKWKVALKKAGTLRFLCDPHAGQGMKGSAKIVK